MNTNVSFEENAHPRHSQQFRGGNPPPVPSKKDGPPSSYAGGAGVPTLDYADPGYAEAGYGGPSGYPGFSNTAGGGDARRKKSMIRPERERIEPGHRLYHYREAATEDNIRVHPSSKSK